MTRGALRCRQFNAGPSRAKSQLSIMIGRVHRCRACRRVTGEHQWQGAYQGWQLEARENGSLTKHRKEHQGAMVKKNGNWYNHINYYNTRKEGGGKEGSGIGQQVSVHRTHESGCAKPRKPWRDRRKRNAMYTIIASLIRGLVAWVASQANRRLASAPAHTGHATCPCLLHSR